MADHIQVIINGEVHFDHHVEAVLFEELICSPPETEDGPWPDALRLTAQWGCNRAEA